MRNSGLLKKLQFSEETIEDAYKVDPTGRYVVWICNEIRSGRIILPDHLEKVQKALFQYSKMRKREDIGQMTVGDLYEYLTDETKISKSKNNSMEIERGSELVFEYEDYKILRVFTSKAVSLLANNTSWCSRNEDEADEYLNDGDLYIIRQNNKSVVQAHMNNVIMLDRYNNALGHCDQGLKRCLKFLSKLDTKETSAGRAYEYVVKSGIRSEDLERVIKTSAEYAYFYACDVIKGRWPEAEEIIKTSAKYAYLYAFCVIKGRWPEAEDTIKASAKYAYFYARYVIKNRWPEAEEIIKTSAEYAYLYAFCVIKGRWPEAEEIIKTSAKYAYLYAFCVIEGRWPEAEDTIKASAKYAYLYAFCVIKGRWHEAEEIIKTSADCACRYACNVIKGRWHEAEETIKASAKYAHLYERDVINSRWHEVVEIAETS